MSYAWAPHRKGAGFNAKVDPVIVGLHIEKLADEYGVCSPTMLVETARPKRSQLHPLFEWDDAKAAERWRIEQARAVVQTIRIVTDEGVEEAPAFVHVRIVNDDGVSEGYAPAIQMQTNEQMRDFVLQEALAQLNSLRRRYGRLERLSKVWEAVDELQVSA